MTAHELEITAHALVAPGKGILAADESHGTIEKRFKSINIANTEDHRRAYRDMLFTTPGAAEFISGVILFDETIRQKALDGTPFPKMLASRGIIPGIKVDAGTVNLPGSTTEKRTQGLDGLRERLAEYKTLGARFAKWRAVITIGDGTPSRHCLADNATALATYAALCQEQGIVPIVEPEVLMDGGHTLERCHEVTDATLRTVFAALHERGVVLERMLLKPNMVISGKECKTQATTQQVAEATVACFRHTVPAAVPGIVFLSGGQTSAQATANLSAMNAMALVHPWQISYSYGRALQDEALKAWKGVAQNVAAGQKAFFNRSKMVSAARSGRYSEKMERELVTA
ncbi:MAG TPA: class I fructose-bisphosphate aldolase [Planctomycetota bacterium]|jgi:fructose-bisphosphate aldolase class I|nr:class I fructose-bisphosphate aldolase [Planctomycetota bacterium]